MNNQIIVVSLNLKYRLCFLIKCLLSLNSDSSTHNVEAGSGTQPWHQFFFKIRTPALPLASVPRLALISHYRG